MSDSDTDDEAVVGTHISDDEDASKRTRRDKVLRAADPEKQAKFQHGHQTEVTDAQGRVRFHGAFTGGFSAGYFNSVGSEEGWAPSEWRSSRSSRGNAAAQRPEDFMDDEDLAALRGEGALVARAGFTKPTRRSEAAPAAATSGAASDLSAGRDATGAANLARGVHSRLEDLLHVRSLRGDPLLCR
jgi:G patch domain-containing protein 1